MLTTFLHIVHVFVCLFLILVVLLQQGRGGGMGSAFGGGAAQQVFGGRGAGNILTKATGVCAAIFMLTSMTLAYIASSGDRELKARIAAESAKSSEATPRTKEPAAAAPAPKSGDKGSESTGAGESKGASEEAPAPAPSSSAPAN